MSPIILNKIKMEKLQESKAYEIIIKILILPNRSSFPLTPTWKDQASVAKVSGERLGLEIQKTKERAGIARSWISW